MILFDFMIVRLTYISVDLRSNDMVHASALLIIWEVLLITTHLWDAGQATSMILGSDFDNPRIARGQEQSLSCTCNHPTDHERREVGRSARDGGADGEARRANGDGVFSRNVVGDSTGDDASDG